MSELKEEKIKLLRNRITNEIGNSCGIEGFNKNDCANELIVGWIIGLLDILEEDQNE